MYDDKFVDLLSRQLPFLEPGQVPAPDDRLSDLGLDSMGMVELMAMLESEYGVRFLDDALDLNNFATPAVLWTTMSQLSRPAA